MATGSAKAKAACELYEQKEKAIKYYVANGVPQKMEEILNSMFYDQPNDVFGHLVNYFDSFAKIPTIVKLKSREVLDTRGMSSIETDVFCTVCNNVKLIGTSVASNESYPPESTKPEEKDLIEEERLKSVTAAVEIISDVISLALWGIDPTKQEEIDNILLSTVSKLQAEEMERLDAEAEECEGAEGSAPNESPQPSDSPSKSKSKNSAKGKKGKEAVVIVPEEPREKLLSGSMAVSAVSRAVCLAGAKLSNIPLHDHIAALRFGEVSKEVFLPQPMVTILSSGKAASGKLNCVKEFMVVPRASMPIAESVKHITNIYNHCAKAMTAKGGLSARSVNDVGALCPQFDRPEQGLDMLQEAMTHFELTPAEDFFIAINCAAHEIFDYDKGKYEVMGGLQKTFDDLVEFWAELLGRYPSIIAIIDPTRKQEQESWMKLSERVSDRCLIAGDYVYHRPGLLKEEDITPLFRTSAVSLKLEQMNSVSDLLTVAKKMEDADNQVIVSSSHGEPSDSFIADLAVGMKARFLKLGGPARGERVAKLNRLIEIESSLREEGRLGSWFDLTFPVVKPPTPEPGEEDGQETPKTPEAKKGGKK